MACVRARLLSILGPCRVSRHKIWRMETTSRKGTRGNARVRRRGFRSQKRTCLSKGDAMRIQRRFTVDGRSPYDGLEFRSATSEIRNPDGSVVFRQSEIEVPD